MVLCYFDSNFLFLEIETKILVIMTLTLFVAPSQKVGLSKSAIMLLLHTITFIHWAAEEMLIHVWTGKQERKCSKIKYYVGATNQTTQHYDSWSRTEYNFPSTNTCLQILIKLVWQVYTRQWHKLHIIQNISETYEAKLHSILNIGKTKYKRHNRNITQQLQTCFTLDTRVIWLPRQSYESWTVMHIILSCRSTQNTKML